VTEASAPSAGCIFCEALARADDEPLLIHRGARAFVILNKFPYNNGHLMVVANRHVGRLAGLDQEELAEIMTLTQAAERALDAAYHPHAYNVGLNLGKPAGAGVLDHLHMHVVPRWDGDTNFMSVVGDTRVLPEELPATVARLRAAFSIAGASR
jgi:ATP adenylyltransferase